MEIRTGIGYDIHRLVKGRKLILGGIAIPYKKGLLGHSDADVLLHAITDAVLGACACPDIGELFPDSDPAYKDADSRKLLEKAVEIVGRKGFNVSNIDTIIIAEEPKLSVFKVDIQNSTANALKIDKGSVGIKAKTNEGLGEFGKKKAICCFACATLSRREK
jgi:2-C-methyl-D-erythritol 2,4-cyclodiphosphate synthase